MSIAADNISRLIEQLQGLVTVQTQDSWQFYLQGDAPKDISQCCDLERLGLAELNENSYVVFPQGGQLAWFYQQFTLPHHIKNYDLAGLHCRLKLTWWAADAKIYVNGELACEGDLFDSSTRLSLAPTVQPGTTFAVAIALVSPGHDIGALMKSELIFESDDPAQLDVGFVATELAILSQYLEKYQPEFLPKVEQALQTLPLETFQNRAELDRALELVREQLIPLAAPIKERQFQVMGHAHLDMAWLWTADETWEVGQRTFSSVLNLQVEFPELVFGHSTPALYEWIEQHRPDLWEKIKAAVADDRWELLGGMWVEPDVNLLSGESLIRQFLYGQAYFLEKFGQTAPIAWLPDTFGFPQQLPQICKLCGIEAFGTGKLHWNDTKPFPHGLFNWRSPDGTELLTFMSPPNVTGIMDTNPITMTNYALQWEEQTNLKNIFWMPGVGDHGGGPTKDMLEVAQKWQRSPFFPNLQFSTAQNFLKQVKNTPDLPIWDDELYLELHRGYYTVHRDQKEFNRRCETLLRQVELWSAIANSLGENFHHNEIIRDLWKKVLFNQFHDILPGTSIPEVFVEANRDWQYVLDTGRELLEEIFEAIANHIDFSNPPHPEAKSILFFNDLNWKRTETIELKIEYPALIFNSQGQEIPSRTVQQVFSDNSSQHLIYFEATVPSVGYVVYWLVPAEKFTNTQIRYLFYGGNYILENEYLYIEVDRDTGYLKEIFDKHNKCQVLSSLGNLLQAFEDKGQYWDAWDIAPDYEEKPLLEPELISIQWQEKHELRSVIQVKYQLNQSTIIQKYILEAHSPYLRVDTEVDWQEEQVILKVAFPLTIENDSCNYEVPCGAIARNPQQDPAKWEVPALRWADLNDGNYGVSIINNSHHGYDAKPNQIRLTLLKSPIWPDPNADRGTHDFSYAIYPHKNTWQVANTVHHARDFNTPLEQFIPKNIYTKTSKLNATSQSFLSLGDNSLVLLALKQTQNKHTEDIILRVYESTGNNVDYDLTNLLNWEITAELDTLEMLISSDISNNIQPWQIKTFRLSQANKLSNM